MKSRTLLMLSMLSILVPTPSPAAQSRTVTKTIRYIMGENESRQSAREQALRDAKRQALEESGVFLAAATTLKERTREGTGYYTNDSEFASDVQQVTAGITMSEVQKEEWKMEGSTVVLLLTCKVTVDPQDVNARIEKIMESRKRLDPTPNRIENDMDRLKAEIEDMKKRSQPATPGAHPEQPATPPAPSSPFAATRALYERGLFPEALQSVSELMEKNADDAEMRILRGQIYAQMKGRYAMAVRDLETAIKLQPRSVQARLVLADVHLRVGGNRADAKRFIEDALLIAPESQDARRMLQAISK